MNLYLENFMFPTPDREWSEFAEDNVALNFSCYNSVYPYKTLPEYIRKLEFAPITILYGTNGSGKTTMLNLIAECIGIRRSVKINKSSFMQDYVRLCSYEMKDNPVVQKIITSDDVFSNLFLVREKNEIIDKNRNEMFEFSRRCKTPGVGIKDVMNDIIGDENWIDNIDTLLDVAGAKANSTLGFVKRKVGHNLVGKSNGETALDFFSTNVNEPGLYLLDEPENSLSAAYQKELAQFLFEAARFFGAQLIISTHSPFMLSLPGAKIYNLDDEKNPVADDWTRLDNMIEYYNLFCKFSGNFQKG